MIWLIVLVGIGALLIWFILSYKAEPKTGDIEVPFKHMTTMTRGLVDAYIITPEVIEKEYYEQTRESKVSPEYVEWLKQEEYLQRLHAGELEGHPPIERPVAEYLPEPDTDKVASPEEVELLKRLELAERIRSGELE